MTIAKRSLENWRKSSRSDNGGNCVEVALAAETVGVRDTKDRESGLLAVTPRAWSAFTSQIIED